MTTPVIDYVNQYIASESVRMHMPGHKGQLLLGYESRDITEIKGAGELYTSEGPVGEGERNTAALFGTAKTCWVTEGSSQCIRAMLSLALHRSAGASKTVIAARNVHRSFLTACALLDADVVWLTPETADYTLCSCPVTPAQIEKAILALPQRPAAVWLTSPDYLGMLQDISGAAAVCKRHDVPLLIDNAHGAYLKFLEPSCHPIELGADLCCDSAHKTLPALTGCAYLHISSRAPECFKTEAKRMLVLFGSTSPSWILLQSLDAVNPLLESEYPLRLRQTVDSLAAMREHLQNVGWHFIGDEPLKLTIAARKCGYGGHELAERLRQHGIECEYEDPDYLVLMPSPWNTAEDFIRLEDAMLHIPVLQPLPQPHFHLPEPHKVMSARDAMLADAETVPVDEAVGKVLASGVLSCPPAIAVVTAGELISPEAAEIMKYYSMNEVSIVSKPPKNQ